MNKTSKIKLFKQKYTDIDPFIFDLILSLATRKTKEFLYSHPEYKLNFFEIIKLKFYLHKIKSGLPYHYVTKNKDFYNLNFLVNKHTLIPRPETELMVEEVLKELTILSSKFAVILVDVGTGTGCIPISILKNTKTNIQSYAIDLSKKALQTAKKNAKRHNVDIKFLHGDLLTPVIKKFTTWNPQPAKLIITANLPYLSLAQMSESSIQHEPKTALYGGNDGLELYEKLLKQIKPLTKTYNLQPIIYFEIDPSQTVKIKLLIKEYLPQADIQIKKDLNGLDRLVIITIQS